MSAFQILKVFINYIYHLEKQEAKTKLQTNPNLMLKTVSREDNRLYTVHLIYSCYASIYMLKMAKFKPCPLICNWFSIIVVVRNTTRQNYMGSLRDFLPGEFVPYNFLVFPYLWLWYMISLFAQNQLRARDVFCFPSWSRLGRSQMSTHP